MLSSMRKTYDAVFTAKVPLEAAKGKKMIAQIDRFKAEAEWPNKINSQTRWSR
jgi:hypothetical protein